jgi:hypothetical protein
MEHTDDSESDVQQNSDMELLLHGDGIDTAQAVVRFDIPSVAAALGVSQQALMVRMVRILAAALAIDAAELADAQMQERGERLAVDGYPPGWPDAHLAAVACERLFPELSASACRLTVPCWPAALG